MKKRKELNALIGLGDSKRKKTKKGSGHRLLRTEPPDSESESSSEDDDFNNPNSGANFGKSYAQCCNVCYPLFLFIILAACVMACAGLIWMQIALKEDLDSLKEKLHSMELSQKVSSSEIPKINEDLKNKERKLDDVENGDKGLNKLWFNLTDLNQKITLLDTTVNHLKVTLKSAADLVSLPATVEELQKSVATIGSTVTSVQHDVKTMQDALENQKKDDDMKQTMDITDLKRVMDDVNKTEEQHHVWTDEQIHILLSTVADLHQRVASLENGSKHSLQSNDAAAPVRIIGEDAVAENNKEPNTTKATPEDVKEISSPLNETQTSRRPRFLIPKRIKRNAGINCPTRVILPGVSSLKDLEDIFLLAGVGRNSLGVTHQDLKNVFGPSTPSEGALECYDADGDRRYSLSELRAAVDI
ncbi:EF-hand calcium-binding domain-containing protein 14 isoform X2 [Austrofundulus limnaeus]|uniref:EF-hand calcium-binding domain-containing protein 14 isoform X2 n=1 Tax=Austrofundulus limnaeus TaxID=52670 RepID=A0A2I4D0B0_AUSLI|nr:PREDICTED: EF-hand calcium-binding domain-containing protein 14 isoform X2 [Austrofundulus limnaeus]